MIKDIKLGWGIIKYELNFRIEICACLLMTALFGIIEYVTHTNTLSRMIVALFPMLLVHAINLTSASTMIQSSPCKKSMRTTIPALFGTIAMLMVNTYCVISYWGFHEWIINKKSAWASYIFEPGEYEMEHIFMSLFIVVFMLCGVLYVKYYLLAMMIFAVFFVGFTGYISQGDPPYFMISEGLAIAISYGIILIGGLLAYIICLTTYKQDYFAPGIDNSMKRAYK